MGFKKAKKEQVWLKVLLSGASGSGKSYSALRLATGIYSKCGGSGIAYIGTEGSRDKYYANEFDYDLCQLQAPYTADKYLAELSTAIKEGYKVSKFLREDDSLMYWYCDIIKTEHDKDSKTDKLVIHGACRINRKDNALFLPGIRIAT